ncbi:hypothetical protein CTA1_3465 [Colletotrichum tanaceti]|uniref:Uncharacterized protein n=1 Tax=Colletotrichum tanaceti TaxID=1306861 RepID=A0A4U6X4M3_9PEZI|nr:hypothetical protein CTA1_3465 [Colletotrichum tanaceti]
MAIVVLGLSVDLVKGQKFGDAPTTTKYGTFCGGFGLAVAIMGFASAFIDAIPALAVMAADALSGLLLLGGGIVRLLLRNLVNVANGDVGFCHRVAGSDL